MGSVIYLFYHVKELFAMGDKVSRLRQALNEMRVPNKEVAEKCQYAESTVSQYLAGKKKK